MLVQSGNLHSQPTIGISSWQMQRLTIFVGYFQNFPIDSSWWKIGCVFLRIWFFSAEFTLTKWILANHQILFPFFFPTKKKLSKSDDLRVRRGDVTSSNRRQSTSAVGLPKSLWGVRVIFGSPVILRLDPLGYLGPTGVFFGDRSLMIDEDWWWLSTWNLIYPNVADF